MALKAIVKVSSVTNLSDARYCAGMGVEMLGFDIRPESAQFINPLRFQEITGWVAGVQLVGEVHGLNEEQIRALLVQYPVSYLEIDDTSLVPLLRETGLSFILKTSQKEDLRELTKICASNPQIKYLFLDIPKGLDYSELVFTDIDTPILLGYSIEPEQAISLLKKGVNGFVLKGGEETKPGLKDYDQLAEMLEALEDDL